MQCNVDRTSNILGGEEYVGEGAGLKWIDLLVGMRGRACMLEYKMGEIEVVKHGEVQGSLESDKKSVAWALLFCRHPLWHLCPALAQAAWLPATAKSEAQHLHHMLLHLLLLLLVHGAYLVTAV